MAWYAQETKGAGDIRGTATSQYCDATQGLGGRAGRVKVVGGVYRLVDGKVDLLA